MQAFKRYSFLILGQVCWIPISISSFALPYNKLHFSVLSRFAGSSYLPCRWSFTSLSGYSKLPCEVVSVDWRTELKQVRSVLPQALQGNLDPAIFLSNPRVIAEEAERVLKSGLGRAHIFNLGHGILRQTPLGHVTQLTEIVHQFERHQEVNR